MTDTEQRPRWEAGNYLAGLKGVTIPNTAPSFNEDPRKGRHWSSDNAIDANDEGIKSIFDSLKSMPTLKDVPVDVPEPLSAEQQKPAAQDPQPFVAQNPTVQQSSKPAEIQQTEAYDFPTTPKRETVNQEQLRFHEQDTELTPVVEMHGPVQQIDSDPPSFIPGSTPFQKTSADVTQTAVQQPVPTIVNHVLPMDDKLAHTEPQPNYDQNPFADFVIPDTNDSDEDAIPEQRKIKARQVEETLRVEHPDADGRIRVGGTSIGGAQRLRSASGGQRSSDAARGRQASSGKRLERLDEGPYVRGREGDDQRVGAGTVQG